MSPELVVEFAARWDAAVGEMPALEREIASPASGNLIDDIARMMQAAVQDLQDLAPARHLAEPPALIDSELVARFGWLISTLRQCSTADKPCARHLCGALAAAAVWDRGGNVWNVITPLLQNFNDLALELERILGSRQIRPQISPGTPLWEREHLDKLNDADRREDWATLAEIARTIPLPIIDVAFTQAARALWTIAPNRLLTIPARRPTWLDAAILMGAFRIADAFRVAAQCNSARVRFAVLELLANRYHADLSSDEEDALRSLFVAAAEDEPAWAAFMRAFNRHPSMMRPLGRALAGSPPTAVLTYVDAIKLDAGDAGRQAIAICLSEFRRHASKDLRCTLWRRAYDRWDRWNFGVEDGQPLVHAVRSVLDFAVTGWLLECAPHDFVQTQIAEFGQQLRMVNAEWRESVTAFKSAVNRLLSRYLLFAHARGIDAGGEDWLASSPPNLPNELTSAYAKARYGLPWGDADTRKGI